MIEAPTSIGPYRIIEELGRGGMGVVYRAQHRETGALAALKTVRLTREGTLQSLRREIHALARIRHPGIVAILEDGVHEGLPWYAMELLEGLTLHQHFRRGWDPLHATATGHTVTHQLSELDPVQPFSCHDAAPGPEKRRSLEPGRLRELLRVVRTLCAPLAYLHGEGLVHRDLKPGNILVRSDGVPVLMDFGLVSAFATGLSREALEVKADAAGTVAYISPEQGRGGFVDARADLYSIGCILYELLTDRTPFIGNAVFHVLWQHFEAKPAPPSTLVDGVSPQLDEVVLRLLEKEPRERFGHASDLAAALASLGAEEGPTATAPRPRAYLYRPGLAGRDEALDQLTEALHRLVSGSGGCVLIAGESGIGKTRLAMELAREAERLKVGHLSGECLPPVERATGSRAGSLHALRRSLQAIADRCRELGRDETERLLGRRGKLLARYEPSLAGLPGQENYPEPSELSSRAARLRLFSYLSDTFLALADARPLLLILDDLQWADELTLGFLEFLQRAVTLGRRPLLIVGTYRTDEAGSELRALLETSGVERIRLGRLGEAAVGAMAADMLGLRAPAPSFARFLSRQSEGNPFFVAEYLRAALDEGVLYRDGSGRWHVAGAGDREATEADYASLQLPHSLRELVGRRLDVLGSEPRQVAEVAAVLGRDFEERLLRMVTRLDTVRFMEATKELLTRQVFEESEDGVLRFAHDTIREVAHEVISSGARRALHRAAAEAIEAWPGEKRDELLAGLARHWDQAGVVEKALDCYLEAARTAARRFAYSEAERLYRAYLGLVSDSTQASVMASSELGYDVLYLNSRIGEAIDELERAVTTAERCGLRLGEAHCQRNLGIVLYETGQVDLGQTRLERALHLYREMNDPQGEASSLSSLASLSGCRGDWVKSLELNTQALKIYEACGNQLSVGHTLSNMATCHGALGQMKLAEQTLERALSILESFGDRRRHTYALIHLANARDLIGRHDEALSLYERAIAAAREIGDMRAEGYGLLNLAELHANHGRPVLGRKIYAEAREVHRGSGDRRELAGSQLDWSCLERRLGNFEEAAKLLEIVVHISHEVSDRSLQSQAACASGHLALARGAAARDALGRARALDDNTEFPESDSGVAFHRLQRAVEAFEAGQPLFRGECLEDVPEGLRQWLAVTGQLGPTYGSVHS